MNHTDTFMQEEFMPFYMRTFDAFKQNHHTIYAMLDSFLSGEKNHIGIRITQNDHISGDYTIYLEGATISHLETGNLSSEIRTPFGIIKPYVILEKSTLEKMIQDEQNFIKDPFSTKMKYAHDMTVKFLK